jgi:3'(2'), 5'-bisphosphate nucleotidase
VAEGAADLYPRLGTTMEWDTAAGQVIVEEAGGRVVDAASGRPLRYNKDDLRNPHFIATRRDWHD